MEPTRHSAETGSSVDRSPIIEGVRREDPRARALLEGDRDLLAVVQEAVVELLRAFGGARVDLDYFVDAEDEDPVPQVTAVAYPRMSFEKAQQILQRVDEIWFFSNMHRARGRLGLEVHPLA